MTSKARRPAPPKVAVTGTGTRSEENHQVNVVLHIPHASRSIPGGLRGQFLLAQEALDAELLAMTDAHTDLLFGDLVAGAREVVFPVSRLVVDPERFVDDADEPMSMVGMGVVYTRTSRGEALRRNLDAEERRDLLSRFYESHHRALEAAVDDTLTETGSCLVVDCHSFPSVPLPYEFDRDRDRPDICVGMDAFHTPAKLLERSVAAFEREGLRVLVDRPFAGALVPASRYRRDRRVSAVMIEVNRRLYMDESTGSRTPGFESLRNVLRRVLTKVVAS